MEHFTCCQVGAEAAEAIAQRLGVPIHKALDPLDALDFVTISVRLARSLKNATKGEEAAALKRGIETLDVDWSRLSAEQRKEIIRAARREIANTATAEERAERVLAESSGDMVPWTRAASIKRFGLSIPKDLTDYDRDTARLLVSSQMVYVKDEYGRRTEALDKLAKEIVASGLERGLGRDDISGELSQSLTNYGVTRSVNYWNLISTDFANKGRTATQLGAFEEAQIQNYEYSAVMDELTSSICRMLNGRRFSVRTGIEKLREGMELDDPEEIKNVRPWVQEGSENGKPVLYYNGREGRVIVADIVRSGVGARDDGGSFRQRVSDTSLESAGITIPPAHGHCRSTILAV